MKKQLKNNKVNYILTFSGIILISIAFIIFGLIIYPIVTVEARYLLKSKSIQNSNISQNPALQNNQEFRITIPKLGLTSKIIPNVNPYNKEEYSAALSKGAAHAKGSALPSDNGNIFIFAHSTDSPFVSYYNATFYLINKLNNNDEVYLFYQGKKYRYIVTEKKIIDSSEVKYLERKDIEKGQSLTLMTCWPPGTALKRLLIISRLAT